MGLLDLNWYIMAAGSQIHSVIPQFPAVVDCQDYSVACYLSPYVVRSCLLNFVGACVHKCYPEKGKANLTTATVLNYPPDHL